MKIKVDCPTNLQVAETFYQQSLQHIHAMHQITEAARPYQHNQENIIEKSNPQPRGMFQAVFVKRLKFAIKISALDH